MTDAGLRHTDTVPVSATLRVDADQSPSQFWHAIATSDGFQRALVGGVRDLLAGDRHHDRIWTLVDAGVTAADGGLARLLTGLDRAPETDAHRLALDVVAGIVQDGMTTLGHLDVDDIGTGPAAVLDAADRVPTIAVRVPSSIRDRRREHRDEVCRILAQLAQACDVRLVGGSLTVRWLVDAHREVLPSSFSESFIAGQQACTDETVATARDELDPEGRPVRILRDLADEPGETLALAAIHSQHSVSKAAISQCLATLEEFDLVRRYGKRTAKRVELRPAGKELVGVLDRERGRQADLDASFSESCNAASDAVSNRAREGPGEARHGHGFRRHRTQALHKPRWIGRTERDAVAAAAPEHGVGLVDHPVVADQTDRNAPLIEYDPDREQVIVGDEWDNPMSHVVSLAHGLTSRRLWGRIGLEDRLADASHAFDDLFAEYREILRDSRCVGYCPDEAETPAEFLDELQAARDELLEETKRLADGDYEDRDRLRGQICRAAHGLAGTMVHVLNLVDVEIIRYLKVPRLATFDGSEKRDLARCVAIQAAIGSRYNHLTAYRALFESRDDKRDGMLGTEVDAADPVGQLIGRVVIAAPDAEARLGDVLRDALQSPAELQDDAPEFQVQVSVATPDRAAYAEAVTRVLDRKHIRPTREGVTLLRALTGSVLDAARAVDQLAADDRRRELRHDEVRVALALYEQRTDDQRLLPDHTPSTGAVLAALLRAETPQRQADLAETADVSPATVSRTLPKLEALGLVDVSDDGYRLALPFATTAERGSDVLPDPLERDTMPTRYLFDLAVDAIGVANAGRLGDPDDPLGQAFYWPPDYAVLADELPGLGPWVDLARQLCDVAEPDRETVAFGAEPRQASLEAAAAGGEPA